MPTLLVILGSATPPGRLSAALDGAVARAAAGGAEVRLLDLAHHPLVPAGAAGDATTAAVVAEVAAADAVVLATPVYRGSFTGTLKNLLDHVPVDALEGKPVGIVAMGASLHHFLGADRHLRDVLAFFGALAAPVGVYLSSADFVDGAPSPDAAATLDALLADTLALVPAGAGLTLRPLGATATRRG